MEEAKQFMEMMNKALPGAWDAAIRQIYIYGALFTIGTVVSVIVAVACFCYVNSIPEDRLNCSSSLSTEAVVCMIIAVIIGLLCFIGAVLYFINPEYHAMQLIKP
jgi:uncharacterized BrkB/YihY/UPF0761 family membrane protein